jgi:beta-glucosidase/6-phospho-beta-glucosidase/beta-galactosidase
VEEAVNDTMRQQYLHDHIDAVGQALQAGCDVKGYFVWSFQVSTLFVSGGEIPAVNRARNTICGVLKYSFCVYKYICARISSLTCSDYSSNRRCRITWSGPRASR